MTDFSKWSRKDLEALAAEMLAALLRARDWIEYDEYARDRSDTGNEVRKVIAKAEQIGGES